MENAGSITNWYMEEYFIIRHSSLTSLRSKHKDGRERGWEGEKESGWKEVENYQVKTQYLIALTHSPYIHESSYINVIEFRFNPIQFHPIRRYLSEARPK